MIADPATVVLTAHVADWLDEHPARTVRILACPQRHNAGDWGDLDPHDLAANDHALAQRDGRLVSNYPIPDELVDPTDGDTIWIVTDDLADPITTILWPSDY